MCFSVNTLPAWEWIHLSWQKLRYPARLCGCWQRSRRNHQSADGTFRWQNGSNLSHFWRISQPTIRRNHCILSTECRFSLYGKRTDAFYADKDIRHLLLINPDNPSGNFIPLNELMDLLAWTQQRNIHLILDESFVDFSEKSVENTLLKNEVLETYPHLTVIKSISKSYGVPGLRLGIAASSDKEIISYLRKTWLYGI